MLNEYRVISRYVQRSVLSVVSRNRGWSWNVLPADMAVHLYVDMNLFFNDKYDTHNSKKRTCVMQLLIFCQLLLGEQNYFISRYTHTTLRHRA